MSRILIFFLLLRYLPTLMDLYIFRDDHKLLKWNLVNSECMVVTTFPDDFYPTGMHLFPKLNVGGGNKHQHDVILISTADGKLVMCIDNVIK